MLSISTLQSHSIILLFCQTGTYHVNIYISYLHPSSRIFKTKFSFLYLFHRLYVYPFKSRKPHRWCNGQRVRIQWGRSWLRNYKISICYLSAKHGALMRKSKDQLARNQDNMSEWGLMFIRGLLFSENQLVLSMIQLRHC